MIGTVEPAARRLIGCAGLLLLAALAGCRLDTNTMRQSVLQQSGGAEKLFFLENVAGTESQGDLAAVAREAARAGHVHVLQYLQGRGVDIGQADANGWTPMLLAARHGQLAVVRYLVEIVGADVRAKNRGKTTCLMLASGAGQLELCRYLLDRGANVNAKSNHGSSALMYAATSGNADLTRLLVERGADIQIKDNFGNTALVYAEGQAVADYLKNLGLQ
jgi:ankyrin repeat protein